MFCWHRWPAHFSIYVPCDTKLCDFQRWSLRGHNLIFYVLAWKPASPRKCPVFGSRTALFFDLLKICQGHEHCWSTPENLRIIERRSFFFMEIARILRKICDFLSQDLLRELFALCPWSFGMERVCPREVCPWPRIFSVSSTPPLVLYYKSWGVELTSRCFIFMYSQKTIRNNNESTTEE